MRYFVKTRNLAVVVCLLLWGCQSTSEPETISSTQQTSVPAAQSDPHSAPDGTGEFTTVSESERLNLWFEDKYEQQLQMSPLMLTRIGRKDQYDKVDDFSLQAMDDQLSWYANTVDELKTHFDYQALTPEAQISYDIWVYQFQLARDRRLYFSHEYVFTQMQGIQTLLPQVLINFHRVDNLADMEAYIERIKGMSVALNTLLELAKSKSSAGYRPPKFAYQEAMAQINNLIRGEPFHQGADSPLWSDVKAKVTALQTSGQITASQAQSLRFNARKALTRDLYSSYRNITSWMQKDMRLAKDNPTGVSRYPDGDAYYEYRLRLATNGNYSANEIHQIGLDEVDRITEEMIDIKDSVGFSGNLNEFFNYLQTEHRFYYANTDEGRQEYLQQTEANLAFIEEKLADYFTTLPKAALQVKRVEAYREQDGAAPHYYPGTPDGSRPGVYYSHMSDMSALHKNDMQAIAYHEGNPGHHMQISIAQELTGLPKFRTQAQFGAYIEGWALYAEYLAKEMGAYQDPYADFGRLTTEMWRAVRLVVDSGLHAKGWNEQQAVAYFKQHTPLSEDVIRSEVRRYLVWPGQATAYKVGMMKIQSLRKQAQAQLEGDFDLKQFHDTVLTSGALPLHLLEKRVNLWIEDAPLGGAVAVVKD
ncbi:DUF885 domain-containing protein [Thalassotalea litorea]|uniref:DUF885 domain-containing protein n=1 Tax=Thalassotalea litorea TaxID=2020715 RepID=A0A5R9IJF3_9GAMM|nr:DUF885 domain-containing protein [Thalassotalea litorea]TLU64207.1 DUF885 domain-containing protein [Thalassotalea litorea]